MGNQWRADDGYEQQLVLVHAKEQMTETFQVGDRVEVFLDAKFGEREGWHSGTIFRIDPYSEHRSFYWVQFESDVAAQLGLTQISVLNPKNIRRSLHQRK